MTKPPEQPFDKFEFDNDFFDVTVAGQGQGVPAAQQKEEASVEDLKAEAFTAGKAAGLEEAQQKYEAQVAQVLTSFTDQLQQFEDMRTAYLQTLAQDAMEVFAQSLKILVGDAAQHYPQDILSQHLQDILPLVPQKDQLVLRIHPDARTFHEKLTGATAHIQDHFFKIELDTTLAPGDCTILWASGGLDATLADATENLAELLVRFRADSEAVGQAMAQDAPAEPPANQPETPPDAIEDVAPEDELA